MLFSSQVFLLLFLPVVVAVYYMVARHAALRLWWLLAASLLFYGYWDARLVPLLLGSILVNWLVALAYRRFGQGAWIVAGVAFNLGLLGVFKYADFFAETAAGLGGFAHAPWNIVLPLGISFFTFQQLSYLVDLRKQSTPLYELRDFGVYVTMFPQLIAGPIVRHHELVPQFPLDPRREGLDERLARGLAMLAIGLAKKLFIADPLGRIADPIYALAARGELPGFAEGWMAAFAFCFQVYFDFSAYSDMAIGAALMLGLALPLNFDSPLKATSMREFWRRWHMTLTRFMRDYLYVPLGGSRHGELRQAVVTFGMLTLIGLWHGAAWSYVLFGALHGAGLVANQIWHRRGFSMPDRLGWALMFLYLTGTTVVFRAADLASAGRMFAAMAGQGGPAVRPVDAAELGVLAVAAAVAFLAPSSQALALERMRPGRAVAALIAVALVLAAIEAGTEAEVPFVYFQF